MEHIIPTMDHPLSTAWMQPNLDDLLVGETEVLMDKKAFFWLYDYSHSMPSGVYPGKMWKAKFGDDWYLCWFGVVPGDDTVCSNNRRKIIIDEDWKATMGVK